MNVKKTKSSKKIVLKITMSMTMGCGPISGTDRSICGLAYLLTVTNTSFSRLGTGAYRERVIKDRNNGREETAGSDEARSKSVKPRKRKFS